MPFSLRLVGRHCLRGAGLLGNIDCAAAPMLEAPALGHLYVIAKTEICGDALSHHVRPRVVPCSQVRKINAEQRPRYKGRFISQEELQALKKGGAPL